MNKINVLLLLLLFIAFLLACNTQPQKQEGPKMQPGAVLVTFLDTIQLIDSFHLENGINWNYYIIKNGQKKHKVTGHEYLLNKSKKIN